MKTTHSLSFLPHSDTVLVVEEDRALADLIRVSLLRHHFSVQVVFKPEGLSALIDELNPALILMDLFLSGINGLELLAGLKRNGKLDHRRVILISAYGFSEVIERAREVGANDFVVKPVDVDILIQKVKKWSERDLI
ncbi:MAG: response regulator [Anaerolineae bacterium]|nr:response regulator [Anaerolineae bacterium]